MKLETFCHLRTMFVCVPGCIPYKSTPDVRQQLPLTMPIVRNFLIWVAKSYVKIANLVAIVCRYTRNSTRIPPYGVFIANLFFNVLICAAK